MRQVIAQILKIANKLDELNLHKESDTLTQIASKYVISSCENYEDAYYMLSDEDLGTSEEELLWGVSKEDAKRYNMGSTGSKFIKLSQQQQQQQSNPGLIQQIVNQAITAHKRGGSGWQLLNRLIQGYPTLGPYYTNIIKQEFMRQTGNYGNQPQQAQQSQQQANGQPAPVGNQSVPGLMDAIHQDQWQGQQPA
jgi:hypothetical protein